jgi:low temperature requirement protein LtrA
LEEVVLDTMEEVSLASRFPSFFLTFFIVYVSLFFIRGLFLFFHRRRLRKQL